MKKIFELKECTIAEDQQLPPFHGKRELNWTIKNVEKTDGLRELFGTAKTFSIEAYGEIDNSRRGRLREWLIKMVRKYV